MVLTRKRRKLTPHHHHHHHHQQDHLSTPSEKKHSQSLCRTSTSFLRLCSIIQTYSLPILFPGAERPRNQHNLLGSGGTFLVFSDDRPLEHSLRQAHQIRSLADRVVLKRTRQGRSGSDGNATATAAVLAEASILAAGCMAKCPDVVDLVGLTWDFEPTIEGEGKGWRVTPVVVLEAPEMTLEAALTTELQDEGSVRGRLRYCRDVARGLAFLHAKGWAHCDVKTANVLVCVVEGRGSVAKICDFGAARRVDSETGDEGCGGTRPWSAPEAWTYLGREQVKGCDVYSFGMMLWRAVAMPSIIEEMKRGDGWEVVRKIEEWKGRDEMVRVAVRDCADIQGVDVRNILEHCLTLEKEGRWNMETVYIKIQEILDDCGSEEEDDYGVFEGITRGGGDEEDRNSADFSLGEDGDEEDEILELESLPLFDNEFESLYDVFEDEALPVKQELIRALEHFATQHSDADGAEAAYQLARCHFNGYGVPHDRSKALKYLVSAATMGSMKAKAEAPRMWMRLQSDDRAEKMSSAMVGWLEEAVTQGSVDSMSLLQEIDVAAFNGALEAWRQRFCEDLLNCSGRIPNENEHLGVCATLSPREIQTARLNDRGHKLIHVAASLGFMTILQKALEAGTPVDDLNDFDETPLLCACRAGRIDAIEFLLQNGASLLPSKSGETPLHWLIAFSAADLPRASALLISSETNLEPQHTLTEANQLVFDIYPHGTPLDWAVSKRHIPAIETLVELGADPFNNCSSFTAFERAVSLHDIEVLQILLRSSHATTEKVASLDENQKSLLFHAIWCNEPFTRVLHHGPREMEAAVRCIELLIDHGCDPRSTDQDGSTVMHVAAGYCERDFVELILKIPRARETLNEKRGTYDRMPLHQALASQRLDVVDLLVLEGADTSCFSQGKSLAHLCAMAGEEEFSLKCLQILKVDKNEGINLLSTSNGDDDYPMTAFESAIYDCRFRIADYLRSCGADAFAAPNRQPHFLSYLAISPRWDSPQAVQYYLNKVDKPFIMRETTGLSILHVAASLHGLTVDRGTSEFKLKMLLEAFPTPEHINARTIAGDKDDEVVAGQTPLHFAAKFGVYYAAKRLIEVGAELEIADDSGNTPLDLAREMQKRLEQYLIPNETIPVVRDLIATVELLEAAKSSTKLSLTQQTSALSTELHFSRLGFNSET